MPYEIEDEVDWSDGTIDDPPLASTGAWEDSGHVSPPPSEDDGLDYLFESQDEDDHQVPPEIALPPAIAQTPIDRVESAHDSGPFSRRQPSEQYYAHFALYQASQKAYEATFLKHFANQALHSSQFDKCFQDGVNAYPNLQRYVASILDNINDIAKKMVWNAHCRAVSLFASAGKDGALFWDVSSFNQDVFADFQPNNLNAVVHSMNESWHRTAPIPSMIRYTTKEYPIDGHTSPLQEIDQAATTLFSEEASGNSSPTGRTTKHSVERKSKDRYSSGHRDRNTSISNNCNNSLGSLAPPPIVDEQTTATSTTQNTYAAAEPCIREYIGQLQHDIHVSTPPPTYRPVTSEIPAEVESSGLSQLEVLVERFGADALSGQHYIEDDVPGEEPVSQVPPWPTRLFRDHKRRLTQSSPQLPPRTLPGIRAVVAEAMAKGYRPADPNYEEILIRIESRERSTAAPLQRSLEDDTTQDSHQKRPEPQKIHNHGKKREREQPAAIRMFNKPIEPRRKKRRTEASIEGSSNAPAPTPAPRKQRTSTAKSLQPASKPSKQKSPRSEPTRPRSSAALPPHPSGSSMLEPHQHLPPSACFTPDTPSDKPAWRCGIKHALGHYYNAGDRKNCPGCFTALSDNTNAKTMDFYLPSRTHYYQPNPDARWRPSKPFPRARRSKNLSHNSIAKEAYWAANAAGMDSDGVMAAAIAAVRAHIESKLPKEPKEPTPLPSPTPEPDPGPHPSGSTTMEHAQDLPSCASFTAPEDGDQLAWRCDVNHALGRYYLAGDKRTCPGCGSHKDGRGKHPRMDFWLPRGVVVRQEVDVRGWKPRKPYRVREPKTGVTGPLRPAGRGRGSKAVHAGKISPDKGSTTDKTSSTPSHAPDTHKRRTPAPPTHNQFASRKYWAAIARGLEGDAALEWALKETEEWVDARDDETGVETEDEEGGEGDGEGEGEGEERARGQARGRVSERVSTRVSQQAKQNPAKQTSHQDVTHPHPQPSARNNQCKPSNPHKPSNPTPTTLSSPSLPRTTGRPAKRARHQYPAFTASLALNAVRGGEAGSSLDGGEGGWGGEFVGGGCDGEGGDDGYDEDDDGYDEDDDGYDEDDDGYDEDDDGDKDEDESSGSDSE